MGEHIVLSDITATFSRDSKTLGQQSPYLDLEFDNKVYKTTMVKGGGVAVRWKQPVLLDGAAAGGTGILRVIAKAKKTLGADKTLGVGEVDMNAAAQGQGLTTVVLKDVGATGLHAGQVTFNVLFHASGGNLPAQPAPVGGVVDGVGGVGQNVEGEPGIVGGQQGGMVGAPVGGAGVGDPNLGQGGISQGVGTAQTPGSGGIANAGGFGGNNGGVVSGDPYAQGQGVQQGVGMQQGVGAVGAPVDQNQIAMQQQQQQGNFPPQQIHESHTHSVHDHQESETREEHRF